MPELAGLADEEPGRDRDADAAAEALELHGLARGADGVDGGERFGDHSRAEIIQSVHGMSVDCYAFVSIISVRGARYCAEAFAGDDKDVLSADFANGI